MNIENYAKTSPQYYTGHIPKGLNFVLNYRKKFKNILDCGCGDGPTLYSLKKIGFTEGNNVLAIDISKSRVELVKKIDATFKVKVDSAETLKTVKNKSVDLFISTQVIEHVDDKKMVSAITRVMKKGGFVYISTVFKKFYGWYFYKRDGKWWLDPTHLREYQSENELLRLFSNKEFKILYNKKSLQWFPILDFVLKRVTLFKMNRYRDSFVWRLLRQLKLPILGYYEWELVFEKK